MTRTRTLTTALGATGLVLASVALCAPAQAATAPTPPAPHVTHLKVGDTTTVADVTGQPGAVVRVFDGTKVVGVKLLGSTGSGQVSVPLGHPDLDAKLAVEQTKDGQTSDAEVVNWFAAPVVKVVKEYEGGAVVKLRTNAGGVVKVVDEKGKAIYTSPVSYLSERYLTVPLTKGVTSTFTVTRGTTTSQSEKVTFSATGSTTKLAAPTVTFQKSPFVGQGTWMHVTGAPYTQIRLYDEHGELASGGGTVGANGGYILKNVEAGHTYRVVNSIRDYESAFTTATAPTD